MIENVKLSDGMILPNNIAVKEVKAQEKKTDSGIILPEVNKQPQVVGDVLLCGEGSEKEPMKVQVGMRVIFPVMTGQRFYLSKTKLEEEYIVMPQSKVMFMFWPSPK